MRILLVEDDIRVAEALAEALRRQGHRVHRAGSAVEALGAPPSDVVLLDLGLPDMDGVDVCREMRKRGDEVAIIVITARGDDRSKVAGLRAGADDYLVKPYSLAELYARMEAVMRRARPGHGHVVEIGDLQIDQRRHEVCRGGRPIPLTPKEFELLLCLARDPGYAVPRERMLIEVWHTAWRGAGRTLDVHMATLRGKLGEPNLVQTVRGVGYRLATSPSSLREGP